MEAGCSISDQIVDLINGVGMEEGAEAVIPKPLMPESEKEKQPRISMMSNINSVVKLMLEAGESERRFKVTILIPFPYRFHKQLVERGELTYLQEDDQGVCAYMSEGHIARTVLDFCKNRLPLEQRVMFWKMSYKDAKEVVHQWTAMTQAIPEPAMVLQKSTPGRTFHRLPFDLDVACPTPLFDEFLSRTTNDHALMAWIGSIFDQDADTQQYVWIHGPGRNGKSTLGRFLSKCLGMAATWQQVPHQQDKFWTHGLLGKRLVVFGDCNHPSFVTSGLFKGITGGDGVRVEAKGGASVTMHLKAKVLFFSNRRPDIADEEADTRRLILCETGPIVGGDQPDYEARLWAEAPGILAKCFALYRAVSGAHRTIPAENNLQEAVFDAVDEKFEHFFEQYFSIDKDAHTPRHQVREALRQKFGRDDRLVREFKEFLARRQIVEAQHTPLGSNKKIRVFKHLKLMRALL